jgi:hypothetical protein
MRPIFGSVTFVSALTVVLLIGGCQAAQRSGTTRRQPAARRARHGQAVVQKVFCLYDKKPWLNLDKGGDLDPEGIHYRVFLDGGDGQGIHADGTLHIEMYQIDRKSPDASERTLISDWHLPTDDVQPIESAMLGLGYHLRLAWARKDTAGNEIEIVTMFEDPQGNVARSGTKRFRVPRFKP